MKTVSNSTKGFAVSLQNPYEELTVKELLENKLLIPRKIRHFLRTKKHILINGNPITWQHLVKKGDQIDLFFDQEDYPDKSILMGKAQQVDCLYEDEHMIIVNKPEGMKTHGNEPTELALLNHVSAYTGQTCYVVHRLDMETSGAVVFAKNPFILPILNRLLEKREIKRDYWALVHGTLTSNKVIYSEPIGRHRHDRRKRVVDVKRGQQAITEVTVLKSFKRGMSLVNCRLQTGRTHQIRVHLAYHGHTLCGDPLYGTGKQDCPRLMLHAHQLQLTHPLTQEKICVQATSPTFEKELQSNRG
ncbi:Ribosomal large subunit pseudouridine synthase C [Streptococcus canis]|uniref:Pseudouridine synthase n=1 Tax=Streptococcus canis TaxID=1329 RepID=A0A3P5Y6S9_STRCB|nr:RluA family pseudouridine synthase [Streptococcus canis]MDV5973425.1 RluA family pseudouridine synthase [Streptococcus canis]VDC41786.1 Ribosomal large subunit pseudouridine synthase C [Streptococcus canis]